MHVLFKILKLENVCTVTYVTEQKAVLIIYKYSELLGEINMLSYGREKSDSK